MLAPVLVHLLDDLALVLVLVVDLVQDPVDGAQVDKGSRAASDLLVVWVRIRLGRGELLHLDRRLMGPEAGVAALARWPRCVRSDWWPRVELQRWWLLDDLVPDQLLGVIVVVLGQVASAVSFICEAVQVRVHAPDWLDGRRLSWYHWSSDCSSCKEAGATLWSLRF